MDRRSLLKVFGAVAATAVVLRPGSGEAMPVAPKLDAGAHPVDSGVATDADIEAAQPENAYWVWRRRRRRYWRRRFYWRPRRRYWRRRFYRRRYWY